MRAGYEGWRGGSRGVEGVWESEGGLRDMNNAFSEYIVEYCFYYRYILFILTTKHSSLCISSQCHHYNYTQY